MSTDEPKNKENVYVQWSIIHPLKRNSAIFANMDQSG